MGALYYYFPYMLPRVVHNFHVADQSFAAICDRGCLFLVYEQKITLQTRASDSTIG